MESTGVYWKPIHNLLEADFTLLVVNARHIKAVPGRKTDVKNAEWILRPIGRPFDRHIEEMTAIYDGQIIFSEELMRLDV